MRFSGCFQAAYLLVAARKGVNLLKELCGVLGRELLGFLVGVLPETGTKPSSVKRLMNVSEEVSMWILGIYISNPKSSQGVMLKHRSEMVIIQDHLKTCNLAYLN